MGDNTERAVFYLAASIAKEALFRWEQVLLAGFIIDRFGKSGAKFVGLVGYELVKSQVQLSVNIAKHFGQTIGMDMYTSSRLPQIVSVSRTIARATPATAAISVGAYALAKSPDLTYDFFSDTDNYGKDPEGNLYVHPLILQGATTN
jgi:hypothetical protein